MHRIEKDTEEGGGETWSDKYRDKHDNSDPVLPPRHTTHTSSLMPLLGMAIIKINFTVYEHI